MRAPNAAAALLLATSLSGCAFPATTAGDRTQRSPAELARPEEDPSLRGTPQGLPLPATGEVAVRLRRGPGDRVVVVEFLSAGLSDADRLALQRALEAGQLRPSDSGSGDVTWTTTLRPAH